MSSQAPPAADHLYAARPDEFVAAREALVRELRQAGDTQLASEVHALRRPNLVVWSINQVGRTRPEQVAALFDAADALRAAVGSNDGAAIRTAMRNRRRLVDELTDTALALGSEVSSNPVGHRDAIVATWEAATIDPSVEVRDAIVAGRLTAELRAPETAGFEPAQNATVKSRSRAAEPARPKPARLPRDELATRRAEAALDEARAEMRVAEDALAEAEAELARAQRAVRRARTARERAEHRVERAEQQLEDRRSR